MHLLLRELRPFVFSLAMLFIALGTAFAQDVAVSVSVLQDFDKIPVAVNDTTQAKLKATADPVPPPYCILDPSSAWIWTWEVVSPPANGTVVVTPDPSDNSQATVTASFSDSGDYYITVMASVAIGNSCGPPLTGSGYGGLFVTAVKVKAIQYSVDGLPFQDVPSPFYVLLGKSVTFKALPSPDGASWPAGYPVWGGTSGAFGTGETTTVTFNTLSPTATDYWTVTATCGNTETANVVVYDLVPILTPQDNFEGRDLDYYGVCELIDLSFLTVPTGISEYNIGGLKWQIDSGAGVLTDNGNGTGIYECADVADTVTLSLEITGGPFFAQKKQPPPKGIVPPDEHAMAQHPTKTGLWHMNTKAGGQQSCYVLLILWAKGPKDVSYKEIEVREGESDKAVGDGIFSTMNGKVHTPTVDEKGNPLWVKLSPLVPGKGYNWFASDEAGFENAGDFGDGNFKQNIYMMYRKKLDPKVVNTDNGQWYASNLGKYEAQKLNGVAIVWRDPVGPFMRKAADPDHQNYDP